MATDYSKKTYELARKCGISVAMLCKSAGVSRAAVSQWIGGETVPTIRTWEKIEQAADKIIRRREKSAGKAERV